MRTKKKDNKSLDYYSSSLVSFFFNVLLIGFIPCFSFSFSDYSLIFPLPTRPIFLKNIPAKKPTTKEMRMTTIKGE